MFLAAALMQMPQEELDLCVRAMNIKNIVDEVALLRLEGASSNRELCLQQATNALNRLWPLLKERYKNRTNYRLLSGILLWLNARYPQEASRVLGYLTS